MIIVKEATGPQFFDCTDADLREIVEAFADRSTIEQVFHDVPLLSSRKTGVWGAASDRSATCGRTSGSGT